MAATQVVSALEEGKRIQKRIKYRASDGTDRPAWTGLAEPVFGFAHSEYRIHTEPAWMKIGSDLLASLREDYKWLDRNNKDILMCSKLTPMEVINTISRLKGGLNNAHLLVDQYKERMVTIKELSTLEDRLKGAISEADKAWAHLDIFLKNKEDFAPNHIELKNTKDGSYFRIYGYDVDSVKPTLMNTIKLAPT